MIVEGKQRGGANQLADHLTRRDTNEDVIVRELHNFPMQDLNDATLRRALLQMAAQGLAKDKLRTLYHAFMAPQEGEWLNQKQLKHAVDAYAKNIGMKNHPRIVVEHHKDGRQHFHIVFNILNPDTGKQAKLKFSRMIEWRTGRQLEKELGLKPVIPKGRQSRQWEHQRSKRTGIDPRQVRKEITAIYRASKTGKEFIANLRKGGYVLTKGRNGSYVIVDKAGDIHGLMRRVEGTRLKDLQQRFPDLKNQPLPLLADVLKEQRPHKPSRRNGSSSHKANRKHRGGGFAGTALFTPRLARTSRHGGESYKKSKRSVGGLIASALSAPKLAAPSASIRFQAQGHYRSAARAATARQAPTPIRPMSHEGGWPEAAIRDWKAWGYRAPRQFFVKWPELSA